MAERDEKSILRYLFREGGLRVTHDTKEEEIEDWIKYLRRHGIKVSEPWDVADRLMDIVREECKLIASTETDYPATWENWSKVELYFCLEPYKRFVVIEQYSDPDFWGASISVHKGVRDAVRDYNYTIDNWIDTLYDHSTLDVPGADESLERARSLKHDKLKVREVSRKIRELLS